MLSDGPGNDGRRAVWSNNRTRNEADSGGSHRVRERKENVCKCGWMGVRSLRAGWFSKRSMWAEIKRRSCGDRLARYTVPLPLCEQHHVSRNHNIAVAFLKSGILTSVPTHDHLSRLYRRLSTPSCWRDHPSSTNAVFDFHPSFSYRHCGMHLRFSDRCAGLPSSATAMAKTV